MLDMIRSLFDHQAWADATLLALVRAHPDATDDEKLRRTLHHILLVQRAFLSIFLKRPFDLQKEMQAPESLADLERVFRESESEELAFVCQLGGEDLARAVEVPWFQGAQFTLAETLMQVAMHSHGHRAQCLSQLRAIGATPPNLDFIAWLTQRPKATWV